MAIILLDEYNPPKRKTPTIAIGGVSGAETIPMNLGTSSSKQNIEPERSNTKRALRGKPVFHSRGELGVAAVAKPMAGHRLQEPKIIPMLRAGFFRDRSRVG